MKQLNNKSARSTSAYSTTCYILHSHIIQLSLKIMLSKIKDTKDYTQYESVCLKFKKWKKLIYDVTSLVTAPWRSTERVAQRKCSEVLLMSVS